ncbi:MAG: hypothetical protein HEP71_29640 [Roseivirga sp.]|nr:hypothetical protein [Roseivirga sp.]
MKRIITTIMFAIAFMTLGNQSMAQKGTYTLENYKKESMPKYVVLVAEKGGFIFGSGVQVERRRSKSKQSLKWLQEFLYENKASRNLTDLLNTMDELSFEFVDFVESSSDGVGVGAGDDVDVTGTTSKNRILFVFKKKED